MFYNILWKKEKKGNYMANKMTMAEKEAALRGLELLLILYTTKTAMLWKGMCSNVSYIGNEHIQEFTYAYIKSNKSFIEWINYKFIYKNFYYEPNNTSKRIKYLRKHIKKLKKELKYKI